MEPKTLFFIFTVFGGIRCQSIDTPPSDQTVTAGQNAPLTCRVTEGPGASFVWDEYATNGQATLIFNSLNTGNTDTTRYNVDTVTNKFNMSVLSTTLGQGGSYQCQMFGPTIRRHSAMLVVLGLPVPSTGSGQLREGQQVQLGCSAEYGGPEQRSQLQPAHQPILSMLVNGIELSGTTDQFQDKVRSGDTITSNARMTKEYNYTVNANDDKKKFVCRLATTTPSHSSEGSVDLSVQYSVRGISIFPRNNQFIPGETVNCTAEGNPAPRLEWRPIRSNADTPIQCASSQTVCTLTVLDAMRNSDNSDNQWRCTATNFVTADHSVQAEITFSIGQPTTPPGNNQPGAVNAGVIAAAVIVPLVVIIFAVVVIVVIWRKKKGGATGGGGRKHGQPVTHHGGGPMHTEKPMPDRVVITPQGGEVPQSAAPPTDRPMGPGELYNGSAPVGQPNGKRLSDHSPAPYYGARPPRPVRASPSQSKESLEISMDTDPGRRYQNPGYDHGPHDIAQHPDHHQFDMRQHAADPARVGADNPTFDGGMPQGRLAYPQDAGPPPAQPAPAPAQRQVGRQSPRANRQPPMAVNANSTDTTI